MSKIIEDYDQLVKEAAKAYLEEGITTEERAERRRAFNELSKIRNETLQAEHDFNNRAKDIWERILEFTKTITGNVAPILAYLGVTYFSTVLEQGSYIKPDVVKDALRKCKPDKR